MSERVRKLLWSIHEKLLQLNLFKSRYNDQYGRKSELITTRLYIVLLIAFLTILALYAYVIEHTQTVQIRTPSITTYRALVDQHGDTLSCPCSQLTAAYDTFISIRPVSKNAFLLETP